MPSSRGIALVQREHETRMHVRQSDLDRANGLPTSLKFTTEISSQFERYRSLCGISVDQMDIQETEMFVH
jgi:hypothetical protein